MDADECLFDAAAGIWSDATMAKKDRRAWKRLAKERELLLDDRRDALLYAEFVRLEEAAYRRMQSVEARSSGLVASGAIVAAIVAATSVSVWTVIAAVLLMVSAGIGVAAHWVRTGTLTGARQVWDQLRNEPLDTATWSLNKGMVDTIETIDGIAGARANLNSIGLVLQGAGVVVLVIGLAIQVYGS